MEVEAKFAVPDVATLRRLKTADSLAGLKLVEPRTRKIRDTYLDTADRHISAAGYVCRHRQQDERHLITLKRPKSLDGAVHRREELEVDLVGDRQPADWPPGPLRERVLGVVGDSPLQPLFALDQTRHVRNVILEGELLGELSLDEVVMAADDRETAYFELEIELASEERDRDLVALAAYVEVEWGLEPQPQSKFQRALAFFEGGHAAEAPIVTEPDGHAAEIPAVPDTKPPKRPGLQPDDTMAEAARKTLWLHFRRMLYHEPGTRQGDDIEELHDMRVATRRMRAAVSVFGDHLDPDQIGRFLKGLKGTGRTLGAVRDMDVFGEKMQAYLDSLPEDHEHDLDPLLAAWEAERERARKRLLKYLDSKRYARFKKKFGQFLQTPGAGALPAFTENGDPIPHRLRHVAPVAIYERLAEVRAYDEWVRGPDVPLERLHQLRIAIKRLRYTLEFFAEALGPDAAAVIDECKALQDHLGDLQDAAVASDLLREFLASGVWGQGTGKGKSRTAESVVAPGVADYLAAKLREIEQLVEEFPEVWARFQAADFSRNVAAAVSEL